MKASDVTETLELVLLALGCNQVDVRRTPRLLSDNDASYISGELADWLMQKEWITFEVRHIILKRRGRSSVGTKCWKPYFLENHFLPGDLNASLQRPCRALYP